MSGYGPKERALIPGMGRHFSPRPLVQIVSGAPPHLLNNVAVGSFTQTEADTKPSAQRNP